MQEEIERLERIAPTYFTDTMRGVDQKANHYAIVMVLPLCKGPDVLELGCGDGLWTGKLIEKFGRVEVVDASSHLLEQLKARFGDQVTCHAALFEEFETPCRFDTILMAHILEHIEDPVLVMSRAAAWLKPDGCVIFVVPNAQSLHRRLGKLMGFLEEVDSLSESDHLVGHRRVYTMATLVKDIEASGLKVVESGGVFLKPLSNSQMEDWSDELLEALCQVGKELPAELLGQLYAQCTKV